MVEGGGSPIGDHRDPTSAVSSGGVATIADPTSGGVIADRRPSPILRFSTSGGGSDRRDRSAMVADRRFSTLHHVSYVFSQLPTERSVLSTPATAETFFRREGSAAFFLRFISS